MDLKVFDGCRGNSEQLSESRRRFLFLADLDGPTTSRILAGVSFIAGSKDHVSGVDRKLCGFPSWSPGHSGSLSHVPAHWSQIEAAT
jgi:hypothetical protein